MMKLKFINGRTSFAFLLRLFLIVIVSIFFFEYLIMLIVHQLFEGVSDATFALIDSILLIIVVTPIVFYFLFRPLLESIKELKTKEVALELSKESLKEQVDSQTGALIRLNESLELEVSDRIQAEQILLTMAEEVSAKTGHEFFNSLVRYLSHTIGVKYAFIGELQEDDTVNTISVYAGGQAGENFSYALADTPCNNVIGKEVCIYKSGIKEQFPQDHLLEVMDAESYGGIPLFGSDGSSLGIIAVLDEKPLEDSRADRLKYMLQIIGARAASELERTMVEQNLNESENRFREFADLLPQIAFEVDKQWRFLFLNKNFYTLTGYSPLEVIGKLSPLDMIPLEEIEKTIKKIKLLTSGEDDQKPAEINYLRKDGSTFPALMYAKSINDENGVAGLRGIIIDVSDMRESEKALKTSEERYRTIFESAGTALIITDEHLNITFTNNNFRHLTGYADLDGKRKFTELCGLEYKDLIQDYNDQVIKSPREAPDNMESVIITSDGRELTVTVSIALMPSQKNRIISVLDITEKQKLHDDAVRAAHLASLGSLAAGVAHEINNPINTVLLNAQHALKSFNLHDNEKDSIEQIIRESNRISNIVKSLLSFSRQEVDVKNPASVMDAMYSALSITEHLFRRDGSRIINNMSTSLPDVYVNVSQIEQVFVNILINARHAVNQKYPDPSEDKIIEIDSLVVEESGRQYVRTVFCDHGTGMSKDIIEKAMNPFFTTKEAGGGTGLGLSISHGLIVDNGGTLRLESSPGKYTRVIIDLPLEGEEDEL
jgi:PAS domain S-box-containing protein